MDVTKNNIPEQIPDKKKARKAAAAAIIGTLVEWYDFLLYSTAAAIVFPNLFFPSDDPFVSQIQSYATFAFGFLARPIGALIFSHFGDRFGRKAPLVYTLILMGFCSFSIGLMPGYESIGVWAPIGLILLRFLQGIAVGGESGAGIFSMEWGHKKNQGFMAGLPVIGFSMGLLLSSLTLSLVMKFSGDAFFTWGWRIPFLLSLVLVVIGLFIRSKTDESPEFSQIKETKQVSQKPIVEVFIKHPKEMALSALVKLSENVPFYIFITFMISYSVGTFNIDKQFLVLATTVASVLMMINIPLFAYLSDKVGIKKLYMIGVTLMFLWAIPYVSLISTGIPIVIFLATILSMFPHNIQQASQSALMALSFPPRLRYSGYSISSQLSTFIGGGIAPMICTFLIYKFGSIYAIGFYILLMTIISFVATKLLKTYQEKAPIEHIEEATINKSL
ncbi:MFS transporter [Neobacillus niacini]|uniref:MFS transporter n=1 Tax=Neobacillus niacini TaxID=86668 RepID=UPI003000C9EF